jgi:hypothetical protein
VTDRRFAALDLGPLEKTEQTEIAEEFRAGFENSLLQKHNAKIANAVTSQDAYELLKSVKFLREHKWHREEFTEVALNMANSAEQLAEDIQASNLLRGYR